MSSPGPFTAPPPDGLAAAPYAPEGLSEAVVLERQASFGANEPVAPTKQALIVQLGRRFASPLVAILLLSCVASAIVRDFTSAAIIVAIVTMSIVVEFVQTHRSERAAAALKARVAQTATVLRDGRWGEVPRRELVPGDVIRLSAGDMVPADAALVEAKDLHVNEAPLTGESLPVEKSAGAPPASGGLPGKGDDACSVFMGTSIVSGRAIAIVTATGPQTAFGEIARGLSLHPPPTEFERGIARFGLFIMKTVLFLVLLVFVFSALLRRDALESLLFAVTLAVGLTPEFLPMITTVTLARGAVRMSRKRVIVKNLAAIQNFGSIDILCCDKTGTLTTGEMKLDTQVDPLGNTSDRPLLLAYVNSYFETGIENPLDRAVLRKAKIDPLDSAVLRHEHPDISGFRKVDEIPFDFERRRVSVVVTRGEEVLLVTKGAPEQVLEVVTEHEVGGQVLPFDGPARERASTTFRTLSDQGRRVLAVAWKHVDRAETFSKDDEQSLTLAGFIAFEDPPRPDACDVVALLRNEGIRIKVISGDNESVCATICDQVGIRTGSILLGRDIDALSDPALAHRAERTNVFARVSPTQKSRILRALKSRGHVVGYLGDGINDAPSLHAADIGISVAGAVDAAKEAAEIILLEPNLKVLLAGVVEGRRAFGNVMKYLLMGTSSNFGNMFSMAGATALLPFLPMLPTQVLLNNFLYDLAQITIPSDNVDETFLRKPRRWNIDLIRRFMLWIGPVSSAYDFVTFYVLLKVFHATEPLFHTGWFVESLATQTLVIFIIRTAQNPLRSLPSAPLVVTTLGVVAVGCLLPFSPLAKWLGFEPLPASFFLFLVIATGTYLLLVELAKRTIMRRALA